MGELHTSAWFYYTTFSFCVGLMLVCQYLFYPINENLAEGVQISNYVALNKSSAANYHIDVFARGSDDALWQISWNGTNWSSWIRIGGKLTSAPAAVYSGIDKIDVFARGSDDALRQISWNGTNWSSWKSLMGQLSSPPTVTSNGNGDIGVFVRAMDNTLAYKLWNGTNWSSWIRIGGKTYLRSCGSLFRNRQDRCICSSRR